MPTINEGPSDKSKALADMAEDIHMAKVTCGVQRKINIGNFESIDVYCAASLPVVIQDLTNGKEIEEKMIAAMEELIYITSKETADKYNAIKGATK